MRIRGSRLTAALVAALLLALGAGATSSPAQFTNFQAAQDDQYGHPPGSEPTPTPTPRPGGGNAGGNDGRPDRPDRPGRGNGREPGDDDTGVGGAGDGRNPGGGVGGNQDTLRDAEGGSLPFTGADLSLIVLLGLLATAGGFALRAAQRASARRAARS